jgi:predicted PurR-regulated permease PerM
MEHTPRLPVYAKMTLIGIGIVVYLYLLTWAQMIILPLMYASLFAMLLHPLVSLLVKWKLNRVLAIFVAITLGMALILGLIYVLGSQVMSFSSTFPKFIDKLSIFSAAALHWASDRCGIAPERINGWMARATAQLSANSGSMIGKTFGTIGILLTTLVAIPVYVFMMLYYEPHLFEFIRRLVQKEHHAAVVEVMEKVRTVVQGYLRGLMIEMVIVAVLNSIALLALGVEYAILLGVLGAVINIIPFIGGVISVSLPMIVALVDQDPLHMLLVLVAYIVIQFIDNHYLVPKVVASKVEVNALISLIAVLVSGILWGIGGMFLSIPLIAILKIICDHIEYLKPWGYLLGDSMPTSPRTYELLKRAYEKEKAHSSTL